ncbi:hypothetical protein AB0G35_23385 [Streptomyces sp. NPDC021749]|uniref:hypothetical protein n=1 Tax=Streptomyces sp. NPDC021749 TaxID=3154905 RepID=UPI0033DB26EF
MNEVLSQVNELLFSSAEGVLVESAEVIDTRTEPLRQATPRSHSATTRPPLSDWALAA